VLVLKFVRVRTGVDVVSSSIDVCQTSEIPKWQLPGLPGEPMAE
jgi:hypothetical protein